METLLTVAALNAHFGRQQVLSSVGFSVAAGEKVALVGESGSGKTVTAQALLQLNPDVRLRAPSAWPVRSCWAWARSACARSVAAISP
jgi:ABC-type glutathione transport system ATPase component